MRFLALFVVALSLATLAACRDVAVPVAPPKCSVDADCSDPNVVCRKAFCSKVDCSPAQACQAGESCTDGHCVRLPAPSCGDQIKNQDETDVDCGGSCQKGCLDGKACVGNGDCVSQLCSNKVCTSKPTLSIAAAVSGNAGSSISFGVTLSAAISADVAFAYNTQDGTAKSGTDYAGQSNTGTILAGATSTAIVVTTMAAPGAQNNLTFSVVISIPRNATLGNATSTATLGVSNPVPTTTGLIPSTAIAGGSDFTLTVNGTNFVSGATVNWNAVALTSPTFVNAAQLTARVPAANIASAGSFAVTVENLAPGGGTSNAQTFTVPVPGCSDAVKNGTETDVDCGGSCGECAIGKKCGADADCTATPAPNAHGVCLSNTCGFDCNTGFSDCGGHSSVLGCVDTKTDLNSCGACGSACVSATGNASCVNGGCSTKVSKLAIGNETVCAVTQVGGVKCWGHIADGSGGTVSTPVDVSGLTQGVTGVAMNPQAAHSCALTVGGGVMCWGGNGSGQLGDGTTSIRSTPVGVSGLASGVVGISISGNTSYAITSGGGVKAWGNNGAGQLGNGTTSSNSIVPVDVLGLFSVIQVVGNSNGQTYALSSAGALTGWGASTYTTGSGSFGYLGDGTSANRLAPVTILSNSVTAPPEGLGGGVFNCAVANGGAKCWGFNANGQLGDGTTTNQNGPVNVAGLGPGSGVTSMTNGFGFICALVKDAVKCWGDNSQGGLGTGGTPLFSTTPLGVSGLGSGVTALSSVGFSRPRSCAIVSGGIKCWGVNSQGELGDNSTIVRSSPVDVVGLTAGVSEVVLGPDETCAITTSGSAKCWGSNNLGQLGDGTFTERHIPVEVKF